MKHNETEVACNLPSLPGDKEAPALPSPETNGQWTDQPWRLLVMPAVLAVAAAAALALDYPVAYWSVRGYCPQFVVDILEIAEPFGHGFGVLLVLLAIHQLDPSRRAALPRVAAIGIGAGMSANLIKMLIGRVRPCYFNFKGTVADTFGSSFPFLSGGSAEQSLPSAHTAAAVAMAIALGWLYPRGRTLFAVLAVLVALQRIQGGAHYVSDTLCGAAVGYLVGTACLKYAPLAARFHRLERRWQARRESTPACVTLPAGEGPCAEESRNEVRRSHAA